MLKSKAAKTGRAAAGKVTSIAPNPVIWQAALMLADGNVRRLRVLDSRTVLVANRENGAR